MAAEFFYNGRGGKMLAENGYIYDKQHKRKLGGSQLPIYKWENFIRFITYYSTTDVAMRLLIKVVHSRPERRPRVGHICDKG